MFAKYKRKIVYSVIFGAIVYLGLSFYASFSQLLIAFGKFQWLMFIPVLLLSLGNYTARYLKYQYYTNVLGIKIEWKMNMLIFMSAFVMSVTPGKLGEVFKSYLLKEQNGAPISKSAPIILAERITDFISLIMLSIFSALLFGYDQRLIIIVGIFFALVVIVLSSKKISHYIIEQLEKIKFISKFSVKIHTAYDSIYSLIKFKHLLVAIIISLFAWFFECYGTYIVINSFGIENLIHVDIFASTFIYGFATIAGSVTMLPGGLGATDASMTYLFISLKNISESVSVAATLLVRIATLWFAVIIGIIAIVFYQKITHKNLNELAVQ